MDLGCSIHLPLFILWCSLECLFCLSVTYPACLVGLSHNLLWQIAPLSHFGGLGAGLRMSGHPSQETTENCSPKAGVVIGIAGSCFTTLCVHFNTMPVLCCWLWRVTPIHMDFSSHWLCACVRVVSGRRIITCCLACSFHCEGQSWSSQTCCIAVKWLACVRLMHSAFHTASFFSFLFLSLRASRAFFACEVSGSSCASSF